jgi:hypothetical protein
MEYLSNIHDTEGMTASEARAYVKKRAPAAEALRRNMHDELVAAEAETKRHLDETRRSAHRHRSISVAAAAEASRNMHKVDPAERDAMRAEYNAWYAQQMAMPNPRQKTPSPAKATARRRRKGKGKGKKGKKAGGRFTQKRRKSVFSLF